VVTMTMPPAGFEPAHSRFRESDRPG